MAYNYVAMGGPTGLVRSNQQKVGKQNDKYNKRIKIKKYKIHNNSNEYIHISKLFFYFINILLQYVFFS